MSSLKDLASLIMVPSLYKDGELHTVKPLADENIIVHPDATDNNDGVDGTTPSTSSNFTFSRGSNLAATRVDVNGLIEKGRENLLLQSNRFDTTWANSDTTETSGQSGYDGTNNAWLLTKSAADGYIYQNISQSGVQTYSVYLKANALNWARVQLNGSGADKYAYFDLANGVIGSSGSGNIDENIESIGNGWYRCSIVADTTSTRLRIYPAQADNDVSGTSGSIYIQDAQLEQGLVATDYIETGTSAAQSGILEDMPRLDYSGGASCPSLLLEPQRSNLIVNSEYFGGWASVVQGTASAPTITTNYDISPDGKQNATRIQFDLNGGTTLSDRVIIRQSLAIQSDYYFSVWMKSATGSEQKILWHSTADDNETTITSDWQRFEFDRNSTSVGWAGLSLRGSTSSVDTADILVWGFQVERGSYKTSYIPTYGTSQTRSEDEAGTSAISGLVGANGGSLFLEISYPEFNSSSRFSLSDGTYDNLVYSRTQATTNGGKIQFLGGDLLLQTPSDYVSLNTFYKVAIGFEENNAVMYVDGVQIATDTSFTMPSGLDFFNFGTTDASINPLRADIKQVLVFPTRLTNAELAALTS